jgi:hypothetical protein
MTGPPLWWVEQGRCADCGVSVGELHRDRTGDVLCLGCFVKRPDELEPRAEGVA